MKRRDFLKRSFAALVIAATPTSLVNLIPETVIGWGKPGSSPVDDIISAMEMIRRNTGRTPDTIAMSTKTYDKMVGEIGAHERIPDEVNLWLT